MRETFLGRGAPGSEERSTCLGSGYAPGDAYPVFAELDSCLHSSDDFAESPGPGTRCEHPC